MYLVLSIVAGEQRGSNCVFDRQGGVVGRSAACDWTLHDPTNTISSRHAVISFADNRYFISDTSTNGTFLNGSPSPIGKGRAAALKPGDQIVIGDLEIVVDIVDRPADEPAPDAALANGQGRPRAAPVHSGDALAGLGAGGVARGGDVLGGLGAGAAAPPPNPHVHAVSSALDGLVGGGANGAASIVPNAQPVARTAHQQSMLPGDLGVAPAPAHPPSAPSPAAPQPAAGIPDHLSVDYLLSGRRPDEQPAPAAPAGAPTQAAPPQAYSPPPAVMPNVMTPQPAPVPPQVAPVQAQPSPAMPGMPQQAAMAPEGTTMPVAPMSPPAPHPAAAPAPAAEGGLSPALRANYVELGDGKVSAPAAAVDPVSMLRQRSEGRERARAAPLAERPPPAPAASPASGATPMPRRPAGNPFPRPAAGVAPAPMVAAAPVPVPAAPADAPQATGGADEAAAFWAGLGIDPDHVPDERRSELLEEVGRALRELGQGLVEVLAARRSLKDEFRMEQTRLQATENNPFKFFTSGEKALARIIVGEEGYMRLDEAVRESFRDIKAHEMAAVAALQAALSHVLTELDPQAIGQGSDQRGLFGRGEDRKALWERFVERHAALAGDMDGAARGIVSRAFMEAYERQLGQLKGDSL